VRGAGFPRCPPDAAQPYVFTKATEKDGMDNDDDDLAHVYKDSRWEGKTNRITVINCGFLLRPCSVSWLEVFRWGARVPRRRRLMLSFCLGSGRGAFFERILFRWPWTRGKSQGQAQYAEKGDSDDGGPEQKLKPMGGGGGGTKVYGTA